MLFNNPDKLNGQIKENIEEGNLEVLQRSIDQVGNTEYIHKAGLDAQFRH